jgi:hypothetical protein
MFCRTRGDQIVVFDGEAGSVGSLVDVEFAARKGMTLLAKSVAGVGVWPPLVPPPV